MFVFLFKYGGGNKGVIYLLPTISIKILNLGRGGIIFKIMKIFLLSIVISKVSIVR